MKYKSKLVTFILMLFNGAAYYTIWPLVLMHQYYYDGMQEVFQMTHGQMGTYGMVGGLCSIIGYLLGGILADIFDTKKLLCGAMILQTAGYIFLATLPSYGVLVIFDLIITLAAVGCFWGAFSKYVRILGDNDPTKESRMYGLQYAFVGICGAVLGTIGAKLVSGAATTAAGMQHMFILNAVVAGLTFLVNLFLFKPVISLVGTGEDKFKFSYVLDLIKMPVFWLAGIAILAIYGTSVATSYMSPLLYSIGLPLGVVSAIGSFKYFAMRLIFAPVGGTLMDKTGSPTKIVTCVLILAVVCLFAVGLLPMTAVVLVGAIIICSICYQISTPAWFTSLTEAGIPDKYKGTAVGLFAMLYMSPDFFGYAIGGNLLEKYGDAGYDMIFLMWAVIAVIGLICAVLALRLLKKKKAAQSETVTQ